MLNKIIQFLFRKKIDEFIYGKDDRPQVKFTQFGKAMVGFPKTGGVETFFENHPYPFPGFPDHEIVESMASYKRMIPMAIKSMWLAMQRFLPEPTKYSKPVREIYRVFSLVRERDEDPIMKGKWTEVRDIICMIMEYDDAYRCRLMDALNEMDKSQFEMTEADKYWFCRKQYNFTGKKEFLKANPDVVKNFEIKK